MFICDGSLRVLVSCRLGVGTCLAISVRENRGQASRVSTSISVAADTDPHYGNDQDLPQAILKAIAPLKFDAVALTGDYRDSKDKEFGQSRAHMDKLLRSLTAPKFIVLGNHDYIEQAVAIETVESARVLLNEAQPFEWAGQRIWMCGIDDPGRFSDS